MSSCKVIKPIDCGVILELCYYGPESYGVMDKEIEDILIIVKNNMVYIISENIYINRF